MRIIETSTFGPLDQKCFCHIRGAGIPAADDIGVRFQA